MSKELPYFKFHPSEWLLERIGSESNTVQGAFIRVCAIYWQRKCHLTLSEIESKIGQKLIGLLLEHDYIKSDKEFVKINFLNEQWSDLMGDHIRNVKSGKEGAAKRWGNKGANSTPNKPPVASTEDEEVDKNKKKNTTPKKEYGDPEINEVFNYFKELAGSLDGSIKANRRYAKLLLDKIKKDFPDHNAVDSVKALISRGREDKFHGKNLTGFEYLYRKMNTIINSIQKDGTIDPKMAAAYAGEFVKRRNT